MYELDLIVLFSCFIFGFWLLFFLNVYTTRYTVISVIATKTLEILHVCVSTSSNIVSLLFPTPFTRNYDFRQTFSGLKPAKGVATRVVFTWSLRFGGRCRAVKARSEERATAHNRTKHRKTRRSLPIPFLFTFVLKCIVYLCPRPTSTAATLTRSAILCTARVTPIFS